jgi:hypothetical protein
MDGGEIRNRIAKEPIMPQSRPMEIPMYQKSFRVSLLLIFSAASLAFLLPRLQRIVHAQEPMKTMRLFTAADGLSHIESTEIKLISRTGVPGEQSEPVKAAQSYVVRLQPGYFSSWHNADARRYVIPVSGRAELELSGGGRALIEPGNIWIAEDLTGKGHTFRVLGDQEWIAVFVDFAQ